MGVALALLQVLGPLGVLGIRESSYATISATFFSILECNGSITGKILEKIIRKQSVNIEKQIKL